MMRTNERNDEMESMVKGIEYKTTGEILIIAAVMMYIISAFGFLVLPFTENMNLFIFGVIVAGATGIVIYGGFQLSFYNKLNDKKEDEDDHDEITYIESEQISNRPMNKKLTKQRKDSISTIFSMAATAGYLYIGFMYGLWHPGWIIFLIIPVANALYDLVRTRESY